jgi:hypothetical protein
VFLKESSIFYRNLKRDNGINGRTKEIKVETVFHLEGNGKKKQSNLEVTLSFLRFYQPVLNTNAVTVQT